MVMSRFALYGLFLQAVCSGILLAGTAHSQNSIYEVYVNSDFKQMEVSEVFRQLERATGFHFHYTSLVIANRPLVTGRFKGESLGEALGQIAAQTGLRFKRVNQNIHVALATEAQVSETVEEEIPVQVRVSGKVTSADDGQPLPGVSIVVKGTTSGTTTDFNGDFSLSTSEGAVLQFSYIGFLAQEVTVGAQTTINIVMQPDMEQLQEVVVVGYGTQEKRDITGAIASVDATKLRDLPVAGLDQALQGQVAGVNITQTSGAPGGGINVQVRGISSVNAGSQPLYVIDGIPFYNSQDNNFGASGGSPIVLPQNPLNSINPADIQSIEVLKDAAATAIYGSRAANGVILITTKRGKEGKTNFSFDVSRGIQQMANTIELANAAQYTELTYEGRNLNYIQRSPGALITDDNTTRRTRPGVTSTDLRLLPDFSPWAGVDTDWLDEITQTAQMQNYQFSANGGTSNLQYLFSAGYFDQEGIVIGSRFRRYTMRANIDAKISDRVKVGLNLAPTYSRNNASQTEGNGAWGASLISALTYPPVFPVYDTDGSYFNMGRYFFVGGGFGGVPNTPQMPSIDNPVMLAKENIFEVDQTRLLSSLYADVNIVKGLTFRTMIAGDFNYARTRRYIPTFSLNTSPVFRGATGGFTQEVVWLSENTFNYDRTFGKHKINAVAGYTAQKSQWSRLQAQSTNFPDDATPYVNGVISTMQSMNDQRQEWALVSWLGRVNYSFADRYLLGVAFRTDGSSRFGEQSRYGNFPSVSAGWRVSEEAFLKGIDVLSDLKLRGSWGITGNNEIGNYAHYALIGSNTSTLYPLGSTQNPAGGVVPTNVPNSRLTWETTRQWNIGIDFALFAGRVSVVADYYNKLTTDLLYNVNIPSVTGFSSAIANIGEVENKGWEISLNTVNVDNDRFRWSTNFNISRNQNKLLKLSGVEGDRVFSNTGAVGTTNVTQIGYPIGAFWGLVSNGLFMDQADVDANGIPVFNLLPVPGDRKFSDVTADGAVTADDNTVIGNPLPDFVFGFNNTLRYGNFDLNVMVNGMYGNDIYNITSRFIRGQVVGLANQSLDYYNNRWQSPENPGNSQEHRAAHPQGIYANGRIGSWLVEDGSFVRLRNVTLGYTLPAALVKKVHLSNARVYVSGQNLLTFTKYTGFDPEVSSNGVNPLQAGVDAGAYPMPRIFTVGANVSF